MDGDPESARGGVTARENRAVLKEHLPTILDENSILMHDKPPIHTAGIIKDFLWEWAVEMMELWLITLAIPRAIPRASP